MTPAPFRPIRRLLALAAVAVCAAGTAAAHEMWIEPLDYTVAVDGRLEARLVNGQHFDGGEVAYFSDRVARFEVITGGNATTVTPRLGDRPALNLAAPAEGLAVVVYQSSGDRLTYDNYAVFARFAEHKDFDGIHRRHHDRGLPDADFTEFYTRYAKALIAVGDGAGADARAGLETEIVARANPYTDDLSGGLPVQVFLGDAPRADVQVELFDKAADGTVRITYHRTDAEGIAVLPVQPGHSYLVDAVVIREPDAALAATGAVWETLWAALTFAVPD